MHSIKGGWVGQTFALAKRNESDGRKSRIRRSKEERKAMVETFIKKYQESNNGNFPSLNLTHKEVGGSFYTVREIVRDIIQENRVLGPAKITLQELTSDQFFEHNPLGSIARDPQFAVASNENHPESNNLLDTNGKKLSVSDGYYIVAEPQGFEKGHVINASQVDIIEKESVEATVISNGYYDEDEHVVVDNGQLDLRNQDFSEAAVVSERHYTGGEHHIVDKVQVINGSQVDVINKESTDATNPEMQVSEATDSTETLGELRGTSDLPDNDIKMVEMEKSQEMSELNGVEPAKTSNLLDDKFQDDLGNQILQNKAGLDEEKSLGDDALAESAKDHELKDSTEPQVRVSHQNTKTINQSQMIDGAKMGIEDNFQAKNKTNPSTEGSKAYDEAGLQHKANKHRVDGQIGSNSQRRSITTLNRINLESWDGTPKNSAKQETNPLLAIFKAVIDAFVKFWSE